MVNVADAGSALTRAGLALTRSTVRLQAEGPRSAEQVWEAYAVPSRWSEWSPQVYAVDCPGDRIVPGLRGTVHAPVPSPVPVRFSVTEVDEAARRWSWVVRVGPTLAAVQIDLEHGVLPRTGGGSLTWLTMTGPLPLVTAYAPLARYAIGRLVGA